MTIPKIAARKDVLLTLVSGIWLILILSEYTNTYLDWDRLSSGFPFWGLAVGLVIAGLAAAYFLSKRSFLPNGLMVYAVFVLLIWIVLHATLSVTPVEWANFSVLFKHVIVRAVILLMIVLAAHNWGALLLRMPMFADIKQYPFPVKTALGVMIMVLFLFVLAAGKLLYVYTAIGVFASLIISYKLTLEQLRTLLWAPIGKNLNFLGWATGFVVLLFAAINYASLMRPIPSGFDSLNLYMNLSHLMAQTHELVQGGQPYNWSVFTSLGYVFGSHSSLALGMSYVGGLLALSAVYHLARKWINADMALLAVSLLYTLPSLVFQSYKDMKTDMGLLFILVSATYVFIQWIHRTYVKHKKHDKATIWATHSPLVVTGLLLGFGLGIKFTSYFLIAAMIVGLAYRFGKWIGAVGMLALMTGVTLVLQLDNLSGLRSYQEGVFIWQWSMVVLGLSGLGYLMYQHPQRMKRFVQSVGLLSVPILLVFSPWVFKNAVESQPITLEKLVFGELVFPDFQLDQTATLQADPTLAPAPAQVESVAKPAWTATGVREEIQRYIGYENGLLKYLTVPFDVSFGTHIRDLQNNLGFLFLWLLPLLLTLRKRSNVVWNILIWVGAFLMFGMYRLTVSAQAQGVNLGEMQQWTHEAGGFASDLLGRLAWAIHKPLSIFSDFTPHLVYPILILVFLIGTVLIHYRTRGQNSLSLRVLAMVTYAFICLWLLLSGGITWYGFWLFAALSVWASLWYWKVWNETKYLKYVASAGFSFWLLLAIVMRLSGYDNDPAAQQMTPVVPTYLKYMSGSIPDDGRLFAHMNPPVQQALDLLNANDQTKVYRVGTHYHFFIDNNVQRVREDNQLDLFNRIDLHNNGDVSGIYQSFVANDYAFLLIDLNTANIDQTQEKTLTAKFRKLMNFVNQHPQIQLVATDRIYRNAQGQNEYSLTGQQLVFAGTFALYQIQ